MIAAAERIRKGPAGVNDIAMSIALPKEHPPKRVPTFPQLERTSTLTLERNLTQAVGGVGVTSSRAAVTRMPAHPLWMDRYITSALYMYCSSVFTNSASDLEWFAKTETAPLATYNGHIWALCPADRNATGSVLELALVNAATVNVTIEYTDGGEVRSHYLASLTTTPAILALPAGVWFRIANVDCTAVVANRIAVRLLAAANDYYLLPLTPMPLELNNSQIPYADTRSTASSALFTNVTKVVDQEGTVQAARLNASRLGFGRGPWNFVAEDLSSVHPAERYYGPLQKGLYTFTAPTAEAEAFVETYTATFELLAWPDTMSAATGLTGLSTIKDLSFFNAILFTDDDATTTTTLAITNNVHLEFRTTSSLFTTGYSAIPLEAYHAAQLALCSTGYFFENPIHWAALGSLLIRGLKAALPIVAGHLFQTVMPTTHGPKQKNKQKPAPQASRPTPKKKVKKRRTKTGKLVVRK